MENFPSSVASYTIHGQVYKFLHSYNVVSYRRPFRYMVPKPNLTNWAISVDFATKAEAELAITRCENLTIAGCRLLAGVSWDSGRAGEHNSGWDQGSAKGTNFEEVCHFSLLVGQARRVLQLGREMH
jgi:hypothetical protein